MDRKRRQEHAVPAERLSAWALKGVSQHQHEAMCNQWCYINKYFPFRHPQVCTPVFYGCRSKSTICPPGASRGLIRKGAWFEKMDDESRREVCTWREHVSLSISNHCWIVDSVEQNQTRLKLNCVIRSTLYIQVEECLSVSQYHHSAWCGGWGWSGDVIPFEKMGTQQWYG
jgi:hypothetical protein